ncbi:UNVERIFIED_CONTAM: hypothetical protein RMT77_019935 [Armadillidium vulgare]
MERKFKEIYYDLANNLIHYKENKLETLKRYSLMLLSVTIFKRSDIVKAICPRKNESGKLEKSIENLRRWKFIEWDVESELLEYLKTKSFNVKVLQPHVKELNHFVSMQIYDFINKAVISEFNNIKYFLQNLHFTNQGTINLRNTVRRILKSPSILRDTFLQNPKAKFALACNYFLGKDIKILFEELRRTNTPLNNSTFGSLFEEFWIHIIVNSSDSLKEMSSDTTLNLFQTAVENNNEVAVHYLWFLILKGESDKNMVLGKLVPMTIFPEKINICMFFLLQVNESEFEKYFKFSVVTIIQYLVNHIGWHSHLFRILKMLKSEIDINFLETLDNILMWSYFNSYPIRINFEAFVDCYISLLECVKHDALLEIQFLYKNFEKILLNTFIHEKENLVKLSKFCGRIEIKNFFISEHGINFISEAIKVGNLEAIDEFLFSLFPKNDFEEIRKNVFNFNAYAMSLFFIESFRFQELNIFISNWSVSEEICHRFKRQILYMNQGFFIKKILFNMNSYIFSIDETFSIANEVLTCFEDTLNILIFKRTLILDADKIDEETENFRIPFYNEVRDCVMQSEWEFLGVLLQWKESTSNEKRALRLRLLNDNLLIPVMPMMDERLEFLYQFIQFLNNHLPAECYEDDDINTFKEYVFNVNKFHKLLKKEKLNTIKHYIKWLEPSWEILQKFKWRAELLVGNNHEIVSWLESFQNNLMSKYIYDHTYAIS